MQIPSRVTDLSITNDRIDGHDFEHIVRVQQNFFPGEIQQRTKQNKFVIDFFPDDTRDQTQKPQTQISHSHPAIENDGERENVEKNFAGDFDAFLQHLIQTRLAAMQLMGLSVFQIVEVESKNHVFLA